MKSKERIDARELRKTGLSLGEISKRLRVSKGSVSLWVKDVEIPMDIMATRGKLPWDKLEIFYERNKIDIILLKKYLEKKYMLQTLSKKFKLSQGCVKYWIDKYGLILDRVERKYEFCQLCGKKNGYVRSKYCNTCVSRIRRYKNKIRAVQYKGGKCEECGLDLDILKYAAFEFHHFDQNKEIEIGTVLNRKWETIKSEIEKCRLLCSNCHKIEHTKYDKKLYEATKKYLIIK